MHIIIRSEQRRKKIKVVKMPNPISDDALKYTTRLYDNVLDWYKSADWKAQVLLTIDGIFLAFLTSSIFVAPSQLKEVFKFFGWETWFLFGLMSLCLVGSIVSALLCLWSRIHYPAAIDKLLIAKNVNVKNMETYKPEVMWFFQMITRLDREKFPEKLLNIDREFAIRVLANEIFVLSGNVYKKHVFVDYGFFLLGFTLILFLSVGISYIARFTL